jgi:hypothetical protein
VDCGSLLCMYIATWGRREGVNTATGGIARTDEGFEVNVIGRRASTRA